MADQTLGEAADKLYAQLKRAEKLFAERFPDASASVLFDDGSRRELLVRRGGLLVVDQTGAEQLLLLASLDTRIAVAGQIPALFDVLLHARASPAAQRLRAYLDELERTGGKS